MHQQHGVCTVRPSSLPLSEPPTVQRSPEEKARILARLTLAIAAFDKEQGRADGDA